MHENIRKLHNKELRNFYITARDQSERDDWTEIMLKWQKEG
jgi:hypothetical protein